MDRQRNAALILLLHLAVLAAAAAAIASSASAASAIAGEQVACHRDCQVAAHACCSEFGEAACGVACARGRFLCRQRCGPRSPPCQRRCFLSLFDCLEDCGGRGLRRDACNSQCGYYMSFSCLLDCRRH